MKLVIEIDDEELSHCIDCLDKTVDFSDEDLDSWMKLLMEDDHISWTIGSGFIKYIQIKIKEELEKE